METAPTSPQRAGQSPRRRRPWLLAGLLCAGLLGLAGALAWSYRTDLTVQVVQRALERQGLGPARFIVDRVDFRELHVRDVSLRGGALRAAGLIVTYSPIALATGRIGQIEVVGLRLALTGSEKGLLLGGGPLGGSSSSAGETPMGGGRIDAIRITDAQVVFESGGRRYQATVSADAALDGTRLRARSVVADVALRRGDVRHGLHIVAPTLDLTLEGDGLGVAFTGVSFASADPPWALEGVDGELRWRAGQASAEIVSGTVSSRHTPPLVQPASLRGGVTLKESRVDFAGQLVVEAPGGKGKLALDAKGRHDTVSGSGSAELIMAPVVFRPGGLQPADFFPGLDAEMGRIGGSVALSGPVRWSAGALTSDIVVRLADGLYESAQGHLTGLHGEVRVVGLLPPATAPGQELAGVVEAGGLPPGKAALRFQLRPDSILAVERTAFEVADGRIVTSPFVIDPAELKVETVLQAENVDLSELLRLVGTEGLSGTGRLGGRIPLAVDGSRFTIRDASLAAGGPGVLRIKSDRLPPAVVGAGEEMTLVLRALEDFHYDSLSLELDKRDTGEGTILLRLRGANPAVLAGHPFNFNIKFESNFDRLTDLALRSLTATQELLQRAERSLTK